MTVGLRPNNVEGIASEIVCQLIYELFLGVVVSALIGVGKLTAVGAVREPWRDVIYRGVIGGVCCNLTHWASYQLLRAACSDVGLR